MSMNQDQEIKQRINSALGDLNRALQEAGTAGLTVQIDRLEVTTFGDATPVLLWSAALTRVYDGHYLTAWKPCSH